MRNSFHRIKQFIYKNIRRSTLPFTQKKSNKELLKQVQFYNDTYGPLFCKSRTELRKAFRDYVHYLTNHPNCSSKKHTKRTAPGTVIADQPRTKAHTSEKQMNQHKQGKLQEANLQLSKKLMKSSKVRWKKIG
ncbi:MAG: hypothetical protein FJZ56_01470 [Chlamydiae bacterium]|nr:hypothetical protein [Chlamydiota bacterium]